MRNLTFHRAAARVVAAERTCARVANAHFNSHSTEQSGTRHRLTCARASRSVRSEGLVESARLASIRAQEALRDCWSPMVPVDAAEEPLFVDPRLLHRRHRSTSATSGFGRTEATPTQATPTPHPVVSGLSRTLFPTATTDLRRSPAATSRRTRAARFVEGCVAVSRRDVSAVDDLPAQFSCANSWRRLVGVASVRPKPDVATLEAMSPMKERRRNRNNVSSAASTDHRDQQDAERFLRGRDARRADRRVLVERQLLLRARMFNRLRCPLLELTCEIEMRVGDSRAVSFAATTRRRR